MIEIFLYIALGYLLFTSTVLLRNLLEFKKLKDLPNTNIDTKLAISVCIPARNEAKVIKRCVESILNQDYPYLEVLVLDDHSTDETNSILQQLSNEHPNLTILDGAAKPDDWLGKPWACHQLSEAATGDVLVFIDADVWLERNALTKASSQFNQFDAITVWPQQIVESYWERQIIPHIYYALYTLLPAKYVERDPKWMPQSLKNKLGPEFSAACGQFIAFKKSTYEEIGGHKGIKQHILDDVQLAKKVKKQGFSLRMLSGINTVYCRMYTSYSEIWNGLRKNFLLGFNSTFLFILMGILHLITFILPYYAFWVGFKSSSSPIIILSSILILIPWIHRMILNHIYKWGIYSAFTHSIGVLWFQLLGIRCLIDSITGKKVAWKGREV